MGSAPSMTSNNVDDATDDEQTAEEVRRRRRDIGIDSDDDHPPPRGPVVSKTSRPNQPPGAVAHTQPRKLVLYTESTQPARWHKGALIGKGATGAVFEAVCDDSGGTFAVKEMEFPEDFADNPEDRKRFEALRAEVALLQELQHDNVVRFIGIDKRGFTMCILMEFVSGGSVQQIVKQFGALSEDIAAKYTVQLVDGLRYLHGRNIIHRDIKGANILVSAGGVVKLADFGAAKRILDPTVLQHTLAGTPYWMAPEVVRQEGHGKPADVWSLGATLLQMLTGDAPYQSLPPVPALFKIGHGTDVPVPDDVNVSAPCRDFLVRCLTRSAADRPTVEELAAHPWLNPQGHGAATTEGTTGESTTSGSQGVSSGGAVLPAKRPVERSDLESSAGSPSAGTSRQPTGVYASLEGSLREPPSVAGASNAAAAPASPLAAADDTSDDDAGPGFFTAAGPASGGPSAAASFEVGGTEAEDRIRDFLITMSFTHGLEDDRSMLPPVSPRGDDDDDAGKPAGSGDDDEDVAVGEFDEDEFREFVSGLGDAADAPR